MKRGVLRIAVLDQHTQWNATTRISSDVTILNGLGDIHPFRYGPLIKSDVVFFHRCDKNFIFYWMTRKDVFPNLKEVYLNSHPCDPRIVRAMFITPAIRWNITDYWWHYIPRWDPGVSSPPPPRHIQPISQGDYALKLRLFGFDDIVRNKD